MHASSELPRRLLALAPVALLALGACSDSTAPTGGQVAMSFAARADVTSGAATTTSGGTVIVSGTDTLVLTSARLVIDEMELTRGASGECTTEMNANTVEVTEDCAELKTGPQLVDLPMNGAVSAALSVSLPAGSYRSLEMKMRQAAVDADAAFLAAHPEMNGITVLVTGTYKGQPFTWKGNVEAELELDFLPPMVVDGAGNFTVNLDVARWFRSSTGAIIDPATAGVGQENFQYVAQNIRASFEVFEDDDHDGLDDHSSDSN